MADRPLLMIVDDEAPQLRALCDTLGEMGHTTRGFTSPVEALSALGKEPFDILLTDLRMAGMDGIQLLSSALAMDGNLVVIVMTGHGTIDTAVEAMKAGALDYILKPFKLSAILPVLDRALAVRRLRQENALLEKKVADRTAELEAANRELDAFSYSVSHDLRSPLRHIQGFAEMLAKGLEGKLEGKQAHCMEVILASTRRMGTLIDNLLEFARLGRAELKAGPVDMDALVRECIGHLRPEAEARTVVWDIRPLPRALGDASLLRQVVLNLLSNALKYTRNRPEARIEVGSAHAAGPEDACYYVRDNGAGFDMKYADKLFGVFQRMHKESEFEGTGIGLANVRGIVRRHGGRVWAEAEPDKGATFHFTLPAAGREQAGGSRG
jgi:signal transduction histidine kinase